MTDKTGIEYPCTWSYRIMGEDEEILRALVTGVMAEAGYTLTPGNRSSGGRYISLDLTTRVDSKEHRDSLCRKISGSPAVKMIL